MDKSRRSRDNNEESIQDTHTQLPNLLHVYECPIFLKLYLLRVQ